MLGKGGVVCSVGFGALFAAGSFLSPTVFRLRAADPPQVNGLPGEAAGGTANLISAAPLCDRSLWRSVGNIVRLTFDGDIPAPAPGNIVSQEAIAGGAFGVDLSSSFTIAVEQDGSSNPRILRIQQSASPPSVLKHTQWYGIRNTGDWVGVAPFSVYYIHMIGDNNNDRNVNAADVSNINATGIPAYNVADNLRADINGDGMILNVDLSLAFSHVPTFGPAKPSGHACNP